MNQGMLRAAPFRVHAVAQLRPAVPADGLDATVVFPDAVSRFGNRRRAMSSQVVVSCDVDPLMLKHQPTGAFAGLRPRPQPARLASMRNKAAPPRPPRNEKTRRAVTLLGRRKVFIDGVKFRRYGVY